MEIYMFLKLWLLFLNLTVFICFMIVTLSNQWAELNTLKSDDTAIIEYTSGLWRECATPDGGGASCKALTPGLLFWKGQGKMWLHVVQGLTVSACIMMFIATGAIAYYLYRAKIGCLGVYVNLIAGCLMTAALIVFHRENNWISDYGFEYGWAFDLGVACTVISMFAFVLGLFLSVYLQNKRVQEVKYRKAEEHVNVP